MMHGIMNLKQSLHVSGDYSSIIRRNNCVYATIGARHPETSG